MRVLLVCSYDYKQSQTGDATQGRETARALLAQGHQVDRVYVKYIPIRIYSEEDRLLTVDELNTRIDSCDVIHHLPASRPLCKFWRKLHHKPTLASSIFWGGWERIVIAARTHTNWSDAIRQMLREFHNMQPWLMNYHGIDLFLPNSKAEGECVMRCFGKDRGSMYFPIPNGFVPPTFNVWELPRSDKVPDGDYLVVPGVFACRKNQLGLIRALRHSDYAVVFLGGIVHEDYAKKCRAEATPNMYFTGFISSSSEEYWKILRHARVACLPSDCETPGIAMIEAAFAGARPVITKFGGTTEYYGKYGEYLNPCSALSICSAVARGWERGRLTQSDAETFKRFSWLFCAEETVRAYQYALEHYGR